MKFLAILVGAAACATAQQSSPPDAIRLVVDPSAEVAPLAEDFMGLGYETSAVARTGFFSAQNTHLVQLYRTLSTHGLVRIGGIIGDHTRYEPEGTAASKGDVTLAGAQVSPDGTWALGAAGKSRCSKRR